MKTLKILVTSIIVGIVLWQVIMLCMFMVNLRIMFSSDPDQQKYDQAVATIERLTREIQPILGQQIRPPHHLCGMGPSCLISVEYLTSANETDIENILSQNNIQYRMHSGNPTLDVLYLVNGATRTEPGLDLTLRIDGQSNTYPISPDHSPDLVSYGLGSDVGSGYPAIKWYETSTLPDVTLGDVAIHENILSFYVHID